MTLSTKEQRQLLLTRKLELLSRRTAIHDDVSQKNRPDEHGGEEQAVAKNNDDVLDSLDLAAKAEIERIDGALQRIENGTYTECTNCGKHINPERLHAVPDADLCIECASG